MRIGAWLALVGALSSLGLPAVANDEKTRQIRMFGAQTVTASKRAVAAQMKDPESVQFKDVYANYTEEYDIVACGRVNAKNGFGGYTGFKRFVSDGKRVILEGRDNLAGAWAGACR